MTKHISLRVPDELLARLQAAAGRDRRSLNSEVLWLLERGLDQDEAGE
jgi:predicted HicB family RNase H-like nuclease